MWVMQFLWIYLCFSWRVLKLLFFSNHLFIFVSSFPLSHSNGWNESFRNKVRSPIITATTPTTIIIRKERRSSNSSSRRKSSLVMERRTTRRTKITKVRSKRSEAVVAFSLIWLVHLTWSVILSVSIIAYWNTEAQKSEWNVFWMHAFDNNILG